MPITAKSTMQEVLDAYPSAQRALFRRYHIGGCSSCGYEPGDSLESVAEHHGVSDVSEVLAFLEESASMDARLEVSVQEVSQALKSDKAPRLLDVRLPQEWEAAHIQGAQLFTRAINEEMIDWPKDTPVVFYCHSGLRSLDAASFFAGHGYSSVKSMKGGIDAWSREIDPSVPRYELGGGRNPSVRPLSESFQR